MDCQFLRCRVCRGYLSSFRQATAVWVKRYAPNEFASDGSFLFKKSKSRPTSLDANLDRQPGLMIVGNYDYIRQLGLYNGTALNVEQYPPTTFAKTKTAVRVSGTAHLFHPAIWENDWDTSLPLSCRRAIYSGLAAQRFRRNRTGAQHFGSAYATDGRRYDPALSFPGVDGKSQPRLWRQAWIGRRSEIAADGGAVLGVAERQVRCNCDGRDCWRIADAMVAMIRAKAFAICCRRTRTTSTCCAATRCSSSRAAPARQRGRDRPCGSSRTPNGSPTSQARQRCVDVRSHDRDGRGGAVRA